MKNIFIISRPVQFANVLNIEVPTTDSKILIIINDFASAQKMYNEQKSNLNIWANVFFIKNAEESFKFILKRQDIDNIYLSTDFGLLNCYYLYRLRKRQIYVFEDGWISYTNEIRTHNDRIREFLIRLIFFNRNINRYMGSHPAVKAIYIHNPKLHKYLIPECNKPLLHFKTSLLKLISQTKELESFYFPIKELPITNKKVLLYITSWKFNIKIDKILDEYPNYVTIIKPHPYGQFSKNLLDKFDYKVDSQFLAEIVISQLLNEADELIVVHENSTSVFPFINLKTFKEIDFNSQQHNSNSYQKIRKAMNDINS